LLVLLHSAAISGYFFLSFGESILVDVLAATYGSGVVASSLFILIFQGAITLLSSSLSSVLTEAGIVELSAVGGVMIIMIALSLLKIKDSKPANYFPSIILAPVFVALSPYITSLIPY